MANARPPKRRRQSLDERFTFVRDGAVVGQRAPLRSAIFDVEDKHSGAELALKLWRKTGTQVDEDLRQLWLHEMRQVQRVMSHAGARDVVVDVVELVEDDRDFGVVLQRAGEPLGDKRNRVSRQHWLRNLSAAGPRALFWRNVKRISQALGIIHAQGLVHGRLDADVVMTEGDSAPDFRLGGFEWSLWVAADEPEKSQANVSPSVAAAREERYSFAADWRALGLLVAECLDLEVKPSGEVQPRAVGASANNLHIPERILIKRLVAPTRADQLSAESVARAIDDLVASISRSASTHAGTLVMMFGQQSGLADAIYNATAGEISVDDYRLQLEWVRTDLDGGATLLAPKTFDPSNSWLRIVTNNMVYGLRPLREEGGATWSIAVCQSVESRRANFSIGDSDEHTLFHSICVATGRRESQDLRARFGPDCVDWSLFAGASRDAGPLSETDRIRRALLLVQTIEAVVKALEIYPVEVLDIGRRDGRQLVVLRAEPDNERDSIAKRIGLNESAMALRRLFEDEHRDAEGKWRLSQDGSLGAAGANDVVAAFVDVVDHAGRRAYQFEIDGDLPDGSPLFLRTERDTGTEQVIARRLRNIKALDTRVDLGEMLADPWRVRRSSREELSEDERTDAAFLDLDKPKQDALVGLWSTLPAYLVVGPPGVGKTKLATEVVRRRFVMDRSARMLISAQGHDALDNLQEKIKETLSVAGLTDVLIVRSITPEHRSASSDEVQRTGLTCLEQLSRSALARDAPLSLRSRIGALTNAAKLLEKGKQTVERDARTGLGAVSHLVMDGANIVVSTANSADVEHLVASREQFDWVVVEEAAKAIGPELVGPLMLSGRRLLIGDHHQLPPFESSRLVKILGDHSLVGEALKIAGQRLAPLLRDGELDELELIAADAAALRDVAQTALRLVEPFRSLVEDDEGRARANPAHRPIAATLTEQRRMDPAIAEIVSKAFYKGRLTTEAGRATAAVGADPPVVALGGLPKSPVIVIDFPHVSSSARADALERERPRWHNLAEVDAVVSALRLLRAKDAEKPATLAILSPYKAQVDKLHAAITSARARDLSHLNEFLPVRKGGPFVGTVDSFQGSEADVVILSLVRNNARSGTTALGFLSERRRMNVALSRAKSKLIIVGSLAFLNEAVRGVNPDGAEHTLSFLTDMTSAIDALTKQIRNGIPLAARVAPTVLGGRA